MYTGRVGFPQNYFFTRRTRATKNRIKWPTIRQYTNVVITPKSKKLFDPAQGKVRVSRGLAGPRESPQVYGPRVLLGSEKLYGRNVLRMSLLKIMGSFSFVTAVEDNVKIAVLTAGRPTPSLGRGD